MYLRSKFRVSSITLTIFRPPTPLSPPQNEPSKDLTLIRVKTLATYKKSLTSRRKIMSVPKQLLSDITRIFTGHCPMSGANIQACL